VPSRFRSFRATPRNRFIHRDVLGGVSFVRTQIPFGNDNKKSESKTATKRDPFQRCIDLLLGVLKMETFARNGHAVWAWWRSSESFGCV
jgi:hypothetical protein